MKNEWVFIDIMLNIWEQSPKWITFILETASVKLLLCLNTDYSLYKLLFLISSNKYGRNAVRLCLLLISDRLFGSQWFGEIYRWNIGGGRDIHSSSCTPRIGRGQSDNQMGSGGDEWRGKIGNQMGRGLRKGWTEDPSRWWYCLLGRHHRHELWKHIFDKNLQFNIGNPSSTSFLC